MQTLRGLKGLIVTTGIIGLGCLASAGFAQGPSATVRSNTETASSRFLGRLQTDKVMVSKKADYMFILWDASAYADILAPAQKGGALLARQYALTLALKYGWSHPPFLDRIKVNIVSFKGRDEYGGPRWDMLDKWYDLFIDRSDFEKVDPKEVETILGLPSSKISALVKQAPQEP